MACEPQAPYPESSYAVVVSDAKSDEHLTAVGLCGDCRFMRLIKSDRGSTFFMCERSATDARYPKYPRLPVLHCAGYEPSSADQKRSRK